MKTRAQLKHEARQAHRQELERIGAALIRAKQASDALKVRKLLDALRIATFTYEQNRQAL
jgi:hypothetical protein